MNIIFLDDERNIDDVTWIQYPEYTNVLVARNKKEFNELLPKSNLNEYLFSFDHDIQCFENGNEITGYTLAKELCYYILDNQLEISELNYIVHSKNPIGANNITAFIETFKNFYGESDD